MIVLELIGFLAATTQLWGQIWRLEEAAKSNREKCKQLSEHVLMIYKLMEFQSEWTPNPVMKNILPNLLAALHDGQVLVMSYQKKGTWSRRVFKTHKHAREFDAIDNRISKIMDQIDVNKDLFFINVLDKLLQDGACRCLPQEERKSSIMSLSDTDNMSSDAKRVMELLKWELAHGGLSASSVLPGGRRGGGREEAWINGDALQTEIISLATYIVDEARKLRQNRDEIQQLVSFVQLVADIMQDPQYSQVLRDPNTRLMLHRLKDDLQGASDTIDWLNRQQKNKIARAMLCGPDDSTSEDRDYILKIAYKIEYYVQVLPVTAITQMYA